MHCALYTLSDIPREEGWLLCQPHPVVAVGEGDCPAADVVVADEASARPLLEAIDRQPDAALVLVQLLRAIDHLPITAALTAESIAYGLLQAGESHRRWLEQRDEAPTIVIGESGPPIVLEREGSVLHAELNRPEYRNAISVEMRDALVEMFELVALDDSIERLELSARGGCFSVGGELREFGLSERVLPRLTAFVRCVTRGGSSLSSQAACIVTCTAPALDLASRYPRLLGESRRLPRRFSNCLSSRWA